MDFKFKYYNGPVPKPPSRKKRTSKEAHHTHSDPPASFPSALTLRPDDSFNRDLQGFGRGAHGPFGDTTNNLQGLDRQVAHGPFGDTTNNLQGLDRQVAHGPFGDTTNNLQGLDRQVAHGPFGDTTNNSRSVALCTGTQPYRPNTDDHLWSDKGLTTYDNPGLSEMAALVSKSLQIDEKRVQNDTLSLEYKVEKLRDRRHRRKAQKPESRHARHGGQHDSAGHTKSKE